ncbi:hypothetical protein Tco_1447071 [Tanacetum coccineum]
MTTLNVVESDKKELQYVIAFSDSSFSPDLKKLPEIPDDLLRARPTAKEEVVKASAAFGSKQYVVLFVFAF